MILSGLIAAESENSTGDHWRSAAAMRSCPWETGSMKRISSPDNLEIDLYISFEVNSRRLECRRQLIPPDSHLNVDVMRSDGRPASQKSLRIHIKSLFSLPIKLFKTNITSSSHNSPLSCHSMYSSWRCSASAKRWWISRIGRTAYSGGVIDHQVPTVRCLQLIGEHLVGEQRRLGARVVYCHISPPPNTQLLAAPPSMLLATYRFTHLKILMSASLRGCAAPCQLFDTGIK